MNINPQYTVLRNTFGDRSPLLKISLEYQNQAYQPYTNLDTTIFIDPNTNNIPYSDSSLFNNYLNKYNIIEFDTHKGRHSWYLANKYMFDNHDIDYILSIEDDIIISYDYLLMCDRVITENILDRDKILYFHIGAWEKPRGDINRIVYSQSSSRSILISRQKFELIHKFIIDNDIIANKNIGNDKIMQSVLNTYNMRTIAPQHNRHGHFGVYGWSSNGIYANKRGRETIFEQKIYDEEIYSIIKKSCLNGKRLLELNQNKNPNYFWDFDPNINFTKLEYDL
jgi:hypothetical protein